MLQRFYQKSSAHGDLFQRLLVHSMILSFLLILLYSATNPYTSFAINTLSALTASIGSFEFASLVQKKYHYQFIKRSTTTSFIFLFIYAMIIRFQYMIPVDLSPLPWLMLLAISTHMLCKKHRAKQAPTMQIGSFLFSVLYPAMPLLLLLNILYNFLDSDYPSLGVWWTSFLLSTTKGSDVFSYFFGKAWGKKKLIPSISPNKTVLGLVAGCMSATLIAWIFYLYMPIQVSVRIQYPELIIPLGLVLSLCAFLGDMIESIFKRDIDVKDSSKIKGVGGVLDILDSILFSAPIFYAYLVLTYNLY